MKKEYDFSNAQQGKFYVPIEDIELPVYLDKDIIQYLNEKRLTSKDSLQSFVNNLLHNYIENERLVSL